MGDLFKSAFGYLNPNNQENENAFIGQIVEIGNVKLTVKRLIAEGGFAFVYAVVDPNSGKQYALKRLIASDKASNASVLNEINIVKQLSGHPNIIQYLAAAAVDKGATGTEYLLLTELCPRSLVECLSLGSGGSALPPDIVARVFWQTCKAVQHMHQQVPPIVHRDLKLENLLISNDGVLKLCDFGSCTTNAVVVNEGWSASQRSTLEEQVAQCTTPMYRAPEMLDTWSNYPIHTAADVWALGCILYTLCYANHPFADSAKLKILNANYSIPPGDSKFGAFHAVIRGCLQVDPGQRLTVSEVLDRLSAINETLGYDMRAPLQLTPKAPVVEPPSRPPPPPSSPARPAAPPSRPLPPAPSRPAQIPQAGLFSSIKGGAGSFLKNIKSTSSKVMATVQQSIARSELDISYLTSRVMVMPYPADALELASYASYKVNHADDVREFIEARYPGGRYCVYNLSGRSYAPNRLGSGRVIDVPFGGGRRVATLEVIYRACADIVNFLSRDNKNAVLIHGMDGKNAPAVLVGSLLLFTGVVKRWEDALQMFAVKRMPPELQPSEIRYLEYMQLVTRIPPAIPHGYPVTVTSVTLSPVPMFTKLRDGCRPYIDVYQGDGKIMTSLGDYERMRVFHVTEGKVVLPVNVTVLGDVTIGVFHARQNLGGVMSSGRPTGHRIAQFQIHTGYLKQDQPQLTYQKCDLDDTAEVDHYPHGFHVDVALKPAGDAKTCPAAWDAPHSPQPLHLFANTLEMEETMESFVSDPTRKLPPKGGHVEPPPHRPVRPPPPPVSLPTAPTPVPVVEPQQQRTRQESVDFLGLNDAVSESANTSYVPAPAMQDVDSIFADESEGVGSFPNVQPPKSTHISPSQSKNMLDDLMFDPFGSSNKQSQQPFMPRNNTATPVVEEVSKDPFADLGNLGNNLFPPSVTPSASKPTTPMNGTPAGSPMHRPARTPNEPTYNQGRSPVNADYSRTHFEPLSSKTSEPSKPADIFGDLLGSQGYQFTSKKDAGPRTMNELRKDEFVKDRDPETIKIMEWTSGKKGNIRALLCSMPMVIWEDCKWKRVDMSSLVTAADVKKAYRKACLAVHPDKQVGTENENIAKLIFIELNNAWSDFENDSAQQNLFST